MKVWTTWTTFGAVAFAALGGCANSASCGEGESLCNGLCLPIPSCPEQLDGGMGGNSGDSGPVCADDAPVEGEFGAICTDAETHSDCGCPAPVCAIEPGKAEGFCTKIECDLSDPNGSCPSAYMCRDFSAFSPGAPPICYP
jgi:hypothetical protein